MNQIPFLNFQIEINFLRQIQTFIRQNTYQFIFTLFIQSCHCYLQASITCLSILFYFRNPTIEEEKIK